MVPLLAVRQLTKKFAGLVANDQISFDVKRSEIVGLIGPNGAGKSTLFNCIAGHVQPTEGVIRFGELNITGQTASQVSRAGIARTFQHMRMLKSLSVYENVLVGAFCRLSNKRKAALRSEEMLDLIGIAEYRRRYPTELPTGVQKRVDLARALATEPSLLMLDELMAGLNPGEIQEFIDLLSSTRFRGSLALLICEHVMEVVMKLCQRVIVLDGGRKIADDAPEKVVHDERVIRAYLGDKYAQGRRT